MFFTSVTQPKWLECPLPLPEEKITIATAITITPLQESEKCGPTVEGW